MPTRPRMARPLGRRRPGPRRRLFLELLEGRSLPNATSWPGLLAPTVSLEPDDSFDSAGDLGALSSAIPGEAVGCVGDGEAGPQDRDFYRFQLIHSATVTISTVNAQTASLLAASLQLHSHDILDIGNPQSLIDHRLLAQSSELTSSGETELVRDLGPGTYYVAISGTADTTGDYGLRVTAEAIPFLRLPAAEPDSTRDAAVDLGSLTGPNRAVTVGQIGDGTTGAADIDWVRFSLDRPATLNATVVTEGSSLISVLGLYNSDRGHFGDPYNPSDNRLLAQDDSQRHGGPAHLVRDLAPGIYYLAVSGSGNRFFHPLLADSGTPGSTGSYELVLTTTEISLPIGGPTVLGSEPAAASEVLASPLVLRLALSADLAPETLAPGFTVVLQRSPDATFGDGNDTDVPLTGVNFTGYAKELQVTPQAPLGIGWYRLLLVGDASAHEFVLRGLDGTPLGATEAHPDGKDLAVTFRVGGIEGFNDPNTPPDDSPATARDLGSVSIGSFVQIAGTLGDDPAYDRAGSQELFDDPEGPASFLANPSAEVDLYSFRVRGPGRQAVIIQADGGRIASGFDPALALFRRNPLDGLLELVTFNDNTNNTAPATDQTQPLLTDAVLYTSLEEGDYFLGVSSSGNLPDPAQDGLPGTNGIYDPNVSHSGRLGFSRGNYVLSLVVYSDELPLEVQTVEGFTPEMLAPPTTFTVQFNEPLNLQQLGAKGVLLTNSGEFRAIYLLGADGVEYYPRMTTYDPETGLARFLILDALPNGPTSLRLSGQRGLADLADNPLVGNDESGDYVVSFTIASPERGTNGNPLLWTDSEPNNDQETAQDLGTLFPRELQRRVSLQRNFTAIPSVDNADGADFYRFEVLQSRSYFFTLTTTGFPPGVTLTFALFTVDGEPVATIGGRVRLANLTAGTYVARISGWSAGGLNRGQYQLRISLGTSNESPTPLTTGPAPAYRIRLAGTPDTGTSSPPTTPPPTNGGISPTPTPTPVVTLPGNPSSSPGVVPATTTTGTTTFFGLPGGLTSSFGSTTVGGTRASEGGSGLGGGERLALPGLDTTLTNSAIRAAVLEGGGGGAVGGGGSLFGPGNEAPASWEADGDEVRHRALIEWVGFLLGGLWMPFTLPEIPSMEEEDALEEGYEGSLDEDLSADEGWACGLFALSALALMQEGSSRRRARTARRSAVQTIA